MIIAITYGHPFRSLILRTLFCLFVCFFRSIIVAREIHENSETSVDLGKNAALKHNLIVNMPSILNIRCKMFIARDRDREKEDARREIKILLNLNGKLHIFFLYIVFNMYLCMKICRMLM